LLAAFVLKQCQCGLNKHVIETKSIEFDAASIVLFMLGANSPAPPRKHSRISAIGPSSQERDEQDSGACAGTMNRKTRKRIILPDAIANPEKQRFNIKTSKRETAA
jgi:hypothetical protein